MDDKQVALSLINIRQLLQGIKGIVPDAEYVANECTDKNSKNYKKKFLGIMLPVSEDAYRALTNNKNQIKLHMNGD